MTVSVQSTPLLLEVAPEIDTKPTSFYRKRGRRGVSARLRFGQNEANLLLPLHIQKLKGFSFRAASPPDPLTRGSAPGPRCGLRPQTPVIGSLSRVRHARGSSPPNVILWPHPCLRHSTSSAPFRWIGHPLL